MKIETMMRGLASLGIVAALAAPVLPTKVEAKAPPQAAATGQAMKDKLQDAVNELNLSDDQKAKIKDIFADAKSKREAVWNDASLTDDQKKAKMKDLHADTKAKVNEVLTPEQQTQLKEKLETAKAKAPMNQ
jgi:Spy/CpxP family protein refolding chaperone